MDGGQRDGPAGGAPRQAADIGTYGALAKVWVTDCQGTALFASDRAGLGKQEPWAAARLQTAGRTATAPFMRFHSQAPEDVLYVAVPLLWGVATVAPVVAEQVSLVRHEVDKLAGVVDNCVRFAWPSGPVPQAASVAGICRRAVEVQQAGLPIAPATRANGGRAHDAQEEKK